MSLSGQGDVQAGLQFVSEELGLGFDVLGQVFLGGTGTMRTRRYFGPRSLTNLRTWLAWIIQTRANKEASGCV